MYLSVYIYIYLLSLSLPLYGPLFDYLLVVFPRVGYGRAFIYLRVVRDASGRSPFRILPSLGACKPPSPFASRRCSAAYLLVITFARLAVSLATKTDDPTVSLDFPRSLALYPLPLYDRELVSRRGSRTPCITPPFPLLPHRRSARKSHAGAFAPSAPLRVTGICKSIYL